MKDILEEEISIANYCISALANRFSGLEPESPRFDEQLRLLERIKKRVQYLEDLLNNADLLGDNEVKKIFYEIISH